MGHERPLPPGVRVPCLEVLTPSHAAFHPVRVALDFPLQRSPQALSHEGSGSQVREQDRKESASYSSTKDSSAMSGSIVLSLMNAITLRPPSSSTTVTRSSRMVFWN